VSPNDLRIRDLKIFHLSFSTQVAGPSTEVELAESKTRHCAEGRPLHRSTGYQGRGVRLSRPADALYRTATAC
jgi:hypothetical protein